MKQYNIAYVIQVYNIYSNKVFYLNDLRLKKKLYYAEMFIDIKTAEGNLKQACKNYNTNVYKFCIRKCFVSVKLGFIRPNKLTKISKNDFIANL